MGKPCVRTVPCSIATNSGQTSFDMSDAEVGRYPPLKFQLDGLELEMTSRDYLLRGSPIAASAGQYCLAIRNGGRTGFIFGATTMRNYYVFCDKKERRIGW